MSKPGSGHFKGTKGDIVRTIANLPPKPNKDFHKNWEEVTDPRSKGNSEVYRSNENGLIITFDPAQKGAPGFRGKDHYHIHNPNSTGKKDMYLDKDGNPVPKGSKASHVIKKKEED